MESFSAHSYLLKGTQKVALIDPGSHAHEVTLQAALKDLGNPKIDLILLTHDHWDHGDAAGLFPDAEVLEFGAPASTDLRDPIDLGNFTLEIIETPGHTRESRCFYEPNLMALFAGDTVFEGGSISRIFDEQGGSRPTHLLSLQKLLRLAEERGIESIYPGHNELIQGADTCLHNLKGSVDRVEGLV